MVLETSTAHALQESGECLNAIFDASLDAMLIVDASGIIVLASRRVEAVLGYTIDELHGQQIDMLVPLRFRADHARLRGSFMAEPSTRVMGHMRQIAALRKDGSECEVEIGLSQVVTSIGTFVACSVRDITQRLLVEESARELERKLRYLFDLSPLGIALTDMSGRFLEFNRALQTICGYSESELKDLDYWALTPPSFRLDEGTQLQELSLNGRYGPYEKEYIRKDGSVVPVRLNGVLMTASTGVQYIWSIVEDISGQMKAEEEIRRLAFFDQLTGLPNRVLLQDRLRCVIAASERSGLYGALLLIDLDNFKAINDTRGHGTGDLFLTKVAEILGKHVRAQDTLSRLGGDEFVLVLPELGLQADAAATRAGAIARKLLHSLHRPVELGADAYQCTASIGVTLLTAHGPSCEDAIMHADLAMYQAKAAGRNTVRFFEPAMEESLKARAAQEADLRIALDQRQFVLHYQAQVGECAGIIGAEALIRWQHPQQGMVAPGDFIGVMEQTGLILPVGLWVLEAACSQLAHWATVPHMATLSIAVNVSVHQISHRAFVSQVARLLSATGVNPGLLKLELTESVFMASVPEIARKMSALKEMGIRFSLDDFGTGYSSLAYLKSLPLDQLKIDRSFVRDVLIDANDAAIVRATIALAHSLQLDVIAEGVETQEQAAFLTRAGCAVFQGYLYSRPLPAAMFEQFCRERATGRTPPCFDLGQGF
jgi:diguanylate cyclase (GGDEF)-like protein/PAS domain S-box-containing protein